MPSSDQASNLLCNHTARVADYDPGHEEIFHYPSEIEFRSWDIDPNIQLVPMEIVVQDQHDSPTQILAVTTSETSKGGLITLLRKHNQDTEWRENKRGIIRVQRPTGVKWNQPML